MMKSRQPAVAGFFYPGEQGRLLEEVDACLAVSEGGQQKVRAVVSPHAGYVYSGKVAGQVFGTVEVPERVVVLGPKHRRAGESAAVYSSGAWRFPFGEVPIDAELAATVIEETPVVSDDLAHRDEHSIEVQVPFLWRRNPSVRITPVALGFLGLDQLREIGEGLARAIEKAGEKVLMVASTDMSHQIPQDQAERLDNMAIARILDMDPEGLYDTVVSNDISMCGVIPTTVAIFAARRLGASRASLIRYATSGDVTGDRSQVVGYAALTIC